MSIETELRLRLDEPDLPDNYYDDDEDDELYYYYDDDQHWRELREKQGDVPTFEHNQLIDYLLLILTWRYRFASFTFQREMNFYQTRNQMEKPLWPDLFLIKTIERVTSATSFKLGEGGFPPPSVVMEIISEKTRRRDLFYKPKRYSKWGTAEYFAYDPRERKRRSKKPRLFGWRLNVAGGYDELSFDEQGRMWSEQLEAYLVPDNEYMRLQDRDGTQLLTEAEALRKKLRELGFDPDTL